MTVTEEPPTMAAPPAPDAVGLGAQVRQAFRDTFALVRNPRAALAGAAAMPIIVIFLHGMLDTIADAGIGVVIPDIRREFELSLEEITRVGTIAGVLALIVGIPLGYRTDRTRNRIWWLAGGA